MVVEPTSEKTKEFIWFGEECLRHAARTGRGGTEVRFDGGYMIICQYTKTKATLIDLFSGNFISTPRKHNKNDGYKPQDSGLCEIGDGKLDYPLSDIARTSQVLVIDKGTLSVSRGSEVYGNIDWIGKNTSDEGKESNAVTLTWKGPTGRTLAFNPDLPISGLTTPDIMFNDTTAKYTCFGPNIYSEGSVLDTIPTKGDVEPKVLGAAYQGDILVCVVNNHYPDQLGFFEEVWIKKEEWKKINSLEAGRPTMIWAFNQSGTKATQGVSEYSINVETGIVTIDSIDRGGIKLALHKDPSGNHSTEYSGTEILWSDYKGDERVFATVTAKGGQRFEYNSTASSVEVDAPIHLLGAQTGASLSITSSTGEAIDVGTVLTLVGDDDSCCSVNSITWGVSGFSYTESSSAITVTAISGSGMTTVTATKCATASASFRLPTGVWCTTDTYYDNPDSPGAVITCTNTDQYTLCTEYSGDTRVITSWGRYPYLSPAYYGGTPASPQTAPPSRSTNGDAANCSCQNGPSSSYGLWAVQTSIAKYFPVGHVC